MHTGQDAVCTATATSGNTGEVGTSYQIIVDYYYDDRICVWGNDITFRLTGPDGTTLDLATSKNVYQDGAIY